MRHLHLERNSGPKGSLLLIRPGVLDQSLQLEGLAMEHHFHPGIHRQFFGGFKPHPGGWNINALHGVHHTVFHQELWVKRHPVGSPLARIGWLFIHFHDVKALYGSVNPWKTWNKWIVFLVYCAKKLLPTPLLSTYKNFFHIAIIILKKIWWRREMIAIKGSQAEAVSNGLSGPHALEALRKFATDNGFRRIHLFIELSSAGIWNSRKRAYYLKSPLIFKRQSAIAGFSEKRYSEWYKSKIVGYIILWSESHGNSQ